MHMAWKNISNDGEWFNKWESMSDLGLGDQEGAELRSGASRSHPPYSSSLGLSHRS